MVHWLLSPPVAFLVILFSSWLLMRVLARLALRPGKKENGGRESYACGEKDYNNLVQPDYSGFFSFVFFFTLAHVAALIMCFVPGLSPQTFIMAIVYIVGAMVGLNILLRG